MSQRFNCTDIEGRQIEIKTPTLDACLAAVTDTSVSQDKKALAASILSWWKETTAKPPLTGNTELDRAAQVMSAEMTAASLWDGSYRLVAKTANGVTTKVLEPVEAVA